jgi:hypothetical protein
MTQRRCALWLAVGLGVVALFTDRIPFVYAVFLRTCLSTKNVSFTVH